MQPSSSSSSSTSRKPPSIGGDPFPCTSLQHALKTCGEANLTFIVLPLVHPRLERDEHDTKRRAHGQEKPLTRSDYLLTSQQWGTMIVGKASPWIMLDAGEQQVRRASEMALREEFALATHLGVPAVLCPPIVPNHVSVLSPSMQPGYGNYARSLNHLLSKQTQTHVWLEVLANDWTVWNGFRQMCDTPSNLHAAIVLTDNLPEGLALERWLGDQVRAVIIPTRIFLRNSKGFPTLAETHKRWVVEMYKRNVQFVIRGRSHHGSSTGLLAYQMYLVHACRSSTTDMLTEQEEFESPYYDYLQVPLQPLGDNLESNTYEVFEKDPVKYVRYQDAIRKALKASPKFTTGEQFVAMVVGAGRGPLVQCVLRAARELNLPKERLLVYAVEKNPNAVITLLNLKRTDETWKDIVHVISHDMRTWTGPTSSADVIVSELLGSWGDNELSPECLAGVEKFLNPHHGVSIPWKYTSYMVPIQSHRVWSMVRDLPRLGEHTTTTHDVARFETPYVVRLFNFFPISAEPQPVFVFEHHYNTDSSSSDNHHRFERYATLCFVASEDAVMHGFAGYFDSDLWGERGDIDHVDISINPATASPGMFSWFALFLPLRVPIPVFLGEDIRVSVWRMTGVGKVWYEWSVAIWGAGDVPRVVSTIHNSGGRSSHVML